ncbi:MAG: hypothetical protein ACREQY_22475 [Candidatus Binatia bacterium]
MRLGWIVGLVVPVAVAIAASAPPLEVRSEGDALRVKAVDVPLGEVLAAVTDETGVRFDVDEKLSAQPITVETHGIPLERAIVRLVAALPSPAGHVMRYTTDASGTERLVAVSILAAPATSPPPPAAGTDVAERVRKLEAAGVPRETAERAMALAEEARNLKNGSAPGTFRPEDLPPELHDRLRQLVEAGVPKDQAARQLLLQRRYQEILRELSQVPGGPALLLDAATAVRQ